jgi:hypothetical protein
VQDGVARGFMTRLEEAVALAPPVPQRPPLAADPRATVTSGRDLRKKRDILIASAGPRVRFLRKTGLCFVDRERELHSDNCLWFEARRDLGTLDGFAGASDERPRLFSAQFLKPLHHASLDDDTELVLDGRLGRGVVGWPCRIALRARGDDPSVALTIELCSAPTGWRLRTRMLGLPANAVHHECVPVREVVANDRGGFVADTLVRACTALQVEDRAIAVPGAACGGRIVHEFRLGGHGLDADPR